MTEAEKAELDIWIEHWIGQGTLGDTSRGNIGEWAKELLKDEGEDYSKYSLNTFLDVLKARAKMDVESMVDLLKEQVHEGLGENSG